MQSDTILYKLKYSQALLKIQKKEDFFNERLYFDDNFKNYKIKICHKFFKMP